jgi:hypothetical protein
VYTEFSTLVEINRPNWLLNCSLGLLNDLRGVGYELCVDAAFSLSICVCGCRVEGLYRGLLISPDLTPLIQLHLVHCITHLGCSLVLYGSLNQVFTCLTRV